MVIYNNKTPLKALLILELLVGIFLLIASYYFISNEIYLDIWGYALPLLGLSFLIGSLRNQMVKSIEIVPNELSIVIEKESLLKATTVFIDVYKSNFKLKKANKRSIHIIKKMRLEIHENDNLMVEIKSNLFGLNNRKIKKCYNSLKEFKAPQLNE
ncbi:MAG: hypothetical protein ACPGLV_16690 [Bacteroidia bacterium]